MAMRTSATERAARLLALLPNLRRGERLSLSGLAHSLGADEAQVAADLSTLSMCGVPPYSPDSLVDVEVDGDEVIVWSDPPAMDEPVRFSCKEARALVAALETTGMDPHEKRFQDLLDVADGSGLDIQEAVRSMLVSSTVSPESYGELAKAIEKKRTVRILYFSAHSGRSTERTIEPWMLHNRRGEWYVVAWCREAQDRRTFRVDRIERISMTQEVFDPPPETPSLGPVGFDPKGLPEAVVVFDPEHAPDERQWPGATFHANPDGSVVTHVPMASPGWLARRVVAQLGHAQVISPDSLKETIVTLAKTCSETT